MIKKIASVISIAALLCMLTSIPAVAQSSSVSASKAFDPNRASDVAVNVKTETQPARTLRADLSKMVADAKAGKGLKVVDPQNQPAQSNSLSKAVKIGLVVGIALAIVVTIVFIHARNHLFDDFSVQ